mmetsp:Transcript_11160/g.17544  ORF Transcript_11160/g.17544 Transcript_11160/m.17544 type:complete len:150 (-) Transcript_11160:722-1171(-)
MARPAQWLPAVLAMVAAGLCLAVVIIASERGNLQASGKPVALLDPTYVRGHRMTVLAEEEDEEEAEGPLDPIWEYDAEKLGEYEDQLDAGVPEDFGDALADCMASDSCKGLISAPVRGTASERMPIFRLHPPPPPAEEEEAEAEEEEVA